jgi:Big-like domain-containing protein
MTHRLGASGSKSQAVFAAVSLSDSPMGRIEARHSRGRVMARWMKLVRLFVVAMMIVVPAALMGCGGDNTNTTPADDGGGDALAIDSGRDAAPDARADAGTDGPAAEAAVKMLIAVQVTPAAPTIHLAATQQYVATANFSDGTNQDVSATATWSSSDATIATISAAGLATGVKAGSVTITATVSTGPGSPKSGSAALVVSAAALSSVTVSPPTPTIIAGATQQFTATATYADTTKMDVTSQATWTSGTPATATISTLGLATGVAAGTSTITATFGGMSGTSALTVSAATVVSISVTPNPGSTNVGGANVPFTATALLSTNMNLDVTTTAAWTSSVPATATIGAATGIAVPVAAGTTTITATFGGKSGTAALAVAGAMLTSVTITPPTPSVPAGTTQPFTATAHYSNNTTQDVTSAATWQSSATTVATIAPTGVATGVIVGTSNITATFGGMTSNAAVLTVTTGNLSSIAITPVTPQTIAKGTSVTFIATGTYSDGSHADISAQVTWISTPTGVVAFTGAMATGLTVAQTTVTAALLGHTSPGTTVTVTNATLVSIAVTPTAPATLHLGATQPFVATGTFSDTTLQDLTATAVWASSSTATATITTGVANAGLATGVAGGTTNITAASGLITSPMVALAVNGTATLVSITLTPSALVTLPVGQTQSYTAAGNYSDGLSGDVTATAAWDATDNTGTATSTFTVVKGLVTAVSTTAGLGGGQGLVRARIGSIIGAAPVKVNATTITGIAVTCLSPNTTTSTLTCIPAGVGFQVSCTAIATFSDGNTAPVTTTATWASTTTTVAILASGPGAAHALFTIAGPGSTTITATQGGQTSPAGATSNVTAATETINSLALANTANLNIGQTATFGAVATYATPGGGCAGGTQPFTVTSLATWTSSDTPVATVSNAGGSNGLVTAVTAGTSTIAAAFQGQSGSFALTVNAKCLQALSIDQGNPTLPLGVFAQLTVKATYSDSTTPIQLDSTSVPLNWGGAPITRSGTAWQLNTTGLAAGPHTFTFTVAGGCAGASIQAATVVTVDIATLPTALTIAPNPSTINLGGSVDYAATATYPTYGPLNVSQLATWSITPAPGGGSAFAADALPSQNELFQHHGTTAGAFTVSAVYRNQTGTAALTVSATNTVTAVAVSAAAVGAPTTVVLDAVNGAPVGLPITFAVDITNSDGTHSSNLSGVTFLSSAAGVLSFTGNVATTLAAGTTQVTASISGVTSANFAVIVNTKTLTAGNVTAPAFNIPENTTKAVPVTGTYNPGAQAFDISSLVTSSSANSALVGVATTATGTTATSQATPGPVTLTFLKGGITGTAVATVTGVCITAITVAPGSPSLPNGSSQAFTVSAAFSDGTSGFVTGSVAWSHSGTALNAGGPTFTALATGGDTVTATLTSVSGAGPVCAGGNTGTTTVTGTASVTVSPATVVSITVDTVPTGLTTIPVGESRPLKVTATLTDGTHPDVTSSSTFISGIPGDVSVTSAGVVTANAAGAPTITATYTPTGATNQVVVTAQTCAAPIITITGTAGNIAVGQTELFTAQAVYQLQAGCTATAPQRTFGVTSTATWNSSTAAATITSGVANPGRLTAVAAGTTNVTATYKTVVSNTIVVTPIAVTLTSLTISAGGTVPKGGSELITVTPVWSDGGNYPTTVSFSFDATRVSIDSLGNLTGVAVTSGTTSVTASSGPVGVAGAVITSNALPITVSAACVSGITLSSAIGTTLPVGVPFKVAFTCAMSDGSSPTCTPTFGSGGSVDNTFFAGFAANGQFRIGTTGAGTVTATVTAGTGGCGGGVAGADATQTLNLIGGTATLQSIALSPATINIPKSTNQAYTSLGTYGGGTGANTYSLTSVAPLASNNAIAVANGLPGDQTLPSTVTSQLTAGTAGITSAYQTVTSNTATLTVNATKVLQSIAITAEQNLVGVVTASATYPANGYTLPLHASGLNNDGSSTGDITSQVTWGLATPLVAGTTISTGGVITTGTAAGAQTVSATLSGVTGTFVVNSDAGAITMVNIKSATNGSPSTSVPNGTPAEYEAQAVIGGASYWVTSNFTWASSNTAVGTIVATGATAGTFTAVAASSTTNVTATRGSLTAGPLTVTATGATPMSITCTPGTVSVNAGGTAQLRATVIFSDTNQVEETTSSPTIWTAPNGNVAFTGSHDGIVTGVAAGTATVLPSFTSGGVTVTASVANACVVTVH